MSGNEYATVTMACIAAAVVVAFMIDRLPRSRSILQEKRRLHLCGWSEDQVNELMVDRYGSDWWNHRHETIHWSPR